MDKIEHEILVVGIGASAGGVQALKQFFQSVDPNAGFAYMVVLHLSPDYESQLAKVLQVDTKMNVVRVQQKIKIARDTVYVVSPNRHFVIDGGFVSSTTNMQPEDRRAPIDIFFRALAESLGSKAVGIILSGTGPNGSMGLKRIKEKGGVVFVQNPKEAEFSEMPRNAIATELVDEVLPVAEIPVAIVRYGNGNAKIKVELDSENQNDSEAGSFRELFKHLRVQTGHDFSNYKRATVLRRIERRINVRNLSSLQEYVAYLKVHPNETIALLNDLLISVTNFFRDKKSFEYLQTEILHALLKNKHTGEQLRIWVAGCATGEEAYSIAMLCAELTDGLGDNPKVQIFATDIDERAIGIAREGCYTNSEVADVSPERLRRFFNKEGDDYKVKRELREMVLFATHNFLKDPPFSRLDLISCRNVLIYLNDIAQERVLETFHFALQPGGFLFLGSSESVDNASESYSVYKREYHVYCSRQITPKNFPIPESIPNFRFSSETTQSKTNDREQLSNQPVTFGDLHHRLLEEYAPPSIVVNEEYEILHMSKHVGDFFEFSPGEPTKNLLKLIKPEMRLELRSALFQSIKLQAPVNTKNYQVNINGQMQLVSIQVRPVLKENNPLKGFILVLFKTAESIPDSKEIVLSSSEPVAKQIEEELITIKGQLRDSVEQHETQSEELKASNEELQAMNEELRSAAEELETSKEELQSINEELRTVNQELKIKVEEMSLATNNIQNLINSADIGTIFLDRNLRIALFTPAITKIFNLIESDYGRPITDITHKINYSELVADSEMVLTKLTVAEREVTTTNNRVFTMRLVPYRTDDDRIGGVIMTFFDITRRKKAEEALIKSQEDYRMQLEHAVKERTMELGRARDEYVSLVENTPDVIIRWDNKLCLIFANSAFEERFSLKKIKVYGKKVGDIDGPFSSVEKYIESLKNVFKTGKPIEHHNTYKTKNKEIHFYTRMVPEKNEKGKVISVLAIARDISEIKIAQGKLDVQQKETMNAIIVAQEQERERIGEALHNGVGQLFYAVQARLQTINGKTKEDDKARKELLVIVKDAINDIRKISFELIPSVLKDYGFEKAIRALVQKITNNIIPVKLSFKNIGTRLPEKIEFGVYRILQELINNIVKHSKATNATIDIAHKDNTLLILVSDNGKGFAHTNETHNGIGLANVKNRVDLLNGSITIHSRRGKGTEIFITVPYTNEPVKTRKSA
jgi:two-component system CheB/CheR fusion protein